MSMSHGAISRLLSIPRRTVSNFIARLKNRGMHSNLEHPGRPQITTTAQNKRIIAAAKPIARTFGRVTEHHQRGRLKINNSSATS